MRPMLVLIGIGAWSSLAPMASAAEQMRLTAEEIRSFHDQVAACWNPPRNVATSARPSLTIEFSLDRSGKIEGKPVVTTSSGDSLADESAIRAVIRCGRDGYRLPAAKYDAWQTIIVNFDLSQIATR